MEGVSYAREAPSGIIAETLALSTIAQRKTVSVCIIYQVCLRCWPAGELFFSLGLLGILLEELVLDVAGHELV